MGDSGPDLARGIPLEDLPEGGRLTGHVGDEPVLVVRVDGEVHAIGAVCTHYGGPLGEGLLTGTTVRCPWHHACFDVRSGEPTAAPALNPVPRWRTEVRDGRVYVTGKEERDPLSARGRKADGPASVVIVGAGAAGSAAAEMLRREGYAGPITMVDPDQHAPYDRPNLSKDYLAGSAPEEWIPLRPPGFYEEHGIERANASVESIDVRAHRVRLSDGRTLEYGALLLATGASPIRLAIPGADLPHVHVLRSLEDCRALIAGIESRPRVVIAGASFIGMEAAAALRARGVDVTVVAPERIPFERVLGEEAGRALQTEHVRNGVRFLTGRTLAAIDNDRVVLDNGTEIAAGLVLLGVGVRPLTQLAEAAGLAVDRGVIVDRFLRTSNPDVYAAGDICRYPDPRTGESVRIEHWVVAQRQGQTAARNILGHNEPFASVPFFWTHQHDISVTYVGHAGKVETVEIDGDLEARDCTLRYLRNGQVEAVATIGRDHEALEAEVALERAAQTSSKTAVTSLPDGR